MTDKLRISARDLTLTGTIYSSVAGSVLIADMQPRDPKLRFPDFTAPNYVTRELRVDITMIWSWNNEQPRMRKYTFNSRTETVEFIASALMRASRPRTQRNSTFEQPVLIWLSPAHTGKLKKIQALGQVDASIWIADKGRTVIRGRYLSKIKRNRNKKSLCAITFAKVI